MRPASERLPAELESLRQQCINLHRKLSGHKPSMSGVCISDQETDAAQWRKYRALCNAYLLGAQAAGATEIYMNDLR